jgi:plasmid maintenance system antidote protein VapI
VALFFDVRWFDGRLAEMALGRSDLATALDLSEAAVSEMFKDQREVLPVEVTVMAALLGVGEDEIARRCGISTRPARSLTGAQRIAALEARVNRLEEVVRTLHLQTPR